MDPAIADTSAAVMVLLVSMPSARAAPAPMCFGMPATIVGSGLINGTSGDDVIVGSAGADGWLSSAVPRDAYVA